MRACDYKVYRFVYRTTYHERVSTHGGMDSEPTGRMKTDEREWYGVAQTQEIARAAFDRYHSNDQLLTMEIHSKVDDIVFNF